MNCILCETTPAVKRFYVNTSAGVVSLPLKTVNHIQQQVLSRRMQELQSLKVRKFKSNKVHYRTIAKRKKL